MLVDVRSPAEFAQGNIPGAWHLPLFSDEERAEVGKLYKRVGKTAAIEHGLELVGPKLKAFVVEARALGEALELYCWRGGMRSHSMAWLFTTAGIKCTVRPGGYKAYRRWVLEQLNQPRHFKVLTGLTGAGKTEQLHALKAQGEQVLDLEGVAHHRGSSFGMLGQPPQPTNEQFENELAELLAPLEGAIWVEDESRMIGTCKIPDGIYAAIQAGEKILVDAPREERLQRLVAMYGHFSKEELTDATLRLKKKLGGAVTQRALEAIEQGNFFGAAELILAYYDRAYESFSRKRSGRTCGGKAG